MTNVKSLIKKMAHEEGPAFQSGDLVFIAPSYAVDRHWVRKWVGQSGIVVGLQRDLDTYNPTWYYEVLIDCKKYTIEADDVVSEPVQPLL